MELELDLHKQVPWVDFGSYSSEEVGRAPIRLVGLAQDLDRLEMVRRREVPRFPVRWGRLLMKSPGVSALYLQST